MKYVAVGINLDIRSKVHFILKGLVQSFLMAPVFQLTVLLQRNYCNIAGGETLQDE